MNHFAYFHGFSSSPKSRKGLHFQARLKAAGLTMHLPNLNQPSFSKLSYPKILECLDELDASVNVSSTKPWCIVGSSMGGYLAARWTETRPEKVHKLILLCPGFNMHERWEDVFGKEAMAQWQRDGQLPLPNAVGELVPVHWDLVEQAKTQPPWPNVECPTVIIHGTRDETVPIECSREYAASRPNVELREVDDDHSLLNSLDIIEETLFEFFELQSSAH